jgi:hypothetical protein
MVIVQVPVYFACCNTLIPRHTDRLYLTATASTYLPPPFKKGSSLACQYKDTQSNKSIGGIYRRKCSENLNTLISQITDFRNHEPTHGIPCVGNTGTIIVFGLKQTSVASIKIKQSCPYSLKPADIGKCLHRPNTRCLPHFTRAEIGRQLDHVRHVIVINIGYNELFA